MAFKPITELNSQTWLFNQAKGIEKGVNTS